MNRTIATLVKGFVVVSATFAIGLVAARATAQNVLFNVGRAIGGFGPVVVGAIASAFGFDTAIALLAVLYGVDILAMWLLIPERRGEALA